jgi:hypothetical protein
VKCPLFLQILMKCQFSSQIFEKKNAKISNFMKTCLVGAELFDVHGQTRGQTDRHTGRQAGMMKLIVTFHSSVNMPKKPKTVMREFF